MKPTPCPQCEPQLEALLRRVSKLERAQDAMRQREHKRDTKGEEA